MLPQRCTAWYNWAVTDSIEGLSTYFHRGVEKSNIVICHHILDKLANACVMYTKRMTLTQAWILDAFSEGDLVVLLRSVWGAWLGCTCPLEGRVTANQDHFYPMMKHIYPDGRMTKPLSIRHNRSPNGLMSIKKIFFLKIICYNPFQSSDLGPVEHLWEILDWCVT